MKKKTVSDEEKGLKKKRRAERGQKVAQDIDEIFVKDKGIWLRFFKMLIKAKLPWVWIAAYIILSLVLTNVGVSVTEYTSEMIAGNLSFTGIILPFIGYTVINLLIAAVDTAISYVCEARIDRNLRRMVWGKIVRLPMSYYGKHEPREMITRITSDTSGISTLIIQVIIPMFTGLYTLFVVFRKVGTYDTMLMLSLLAVVPFVLAVAFMMGKLKFGTNDAVNTKYAAVAQEVSEKVNNVQLIKSFATEEKETKSGLAKMKDYYRASIRADWVTQLSSPIYTIVGVLQIIVIILIGRSFYSDGSITLAEWVAYFAFAQQIANQLQAYASYWASFKAYQGATRRVTYIMDEINETLGTDRPADGMCGGFRFENVSFGYGEGYVIKNLSLTVPENRKTAFVGLSGGGKTTLLNLLERFYEPQEGKITVGGDDISSFNMKSYRENIAYITQESTMFSGSIRDNILYGVKREVSQEELEEACRTANAYDFIMNFPEGFDTDVGEAGGKLSGGQKQRIAIARAILRNPRYMFLDEATGAMDAKAKDEVWKGLENLMVGKTVIMVAHDFQTASHADYIVVVGNGEIVDEGSPYELYERNEFFRQFTDSGLVDEKNRGRGNPFAECPKKGRLKEEEELLRAWIEEVETPDSPGANGEGSNTENSEVACEIPEDVGGASGNAPEGMAEAATGSAEGEDISSKEKEEKEVSE